MKVFRWARPVALAVVAVVAVGCAASEANGEAGGGADEVVAKIGDEVITAAELEAELRKNNAKAWQAWYDARKSTLDGMVNTRVLEAEVAKRGTTLSALQAEVTGNATPVTDAEIQAFYAQNRARMSGRPLDDEVKPQIRQHLATQRTSQVMRDFVTELKKQAGVRILLDPLRSEVKIAANDPRKGPEGAPITLVEFSDFQ